MYKYETHAHTSESSLCGHVSAAKALHMHKDAGYQGIIFTDHFNEENFLHFGGVSWEEKIDCYLRGFRSAVLESVRIDLDVLWGIELRFTENDNDFLVYGIDEAFLKERENMHESNITDFMESIEGRDDILVYQAHPYRDGCLIVDPLIVHGLEVHNGNPRHDSRNKKAALTADENHLLVLSGSDFHRAGDIGTGGVVFPERACNIDDFVTMAKKLNFNSLIRKDAVCR